MYGIVWLKGGESGKCDHVVTPFSKGIIDMTLPDSTTTYHDQTQKFFLNIAQKKPGKQNLFNASQRSLAAFFSKPWC